MMKLITLNMWGGHIYDPLVEFIKSYREVDIFCLQEVYDDAPEKISTEERKVCLTLFSDLQKLLPHHTGFFGAVVDGVYGNAIFVSNKLEVLDEGNVNIHDNPHYPGRGPTHSRNLQWIQCLVGQHIYSIFNVHGLWNGRGKADSPERIIQSERIRRFIDTLNTPKILCGDFNLRPDTESVKILEAGMTNHITLSHVTSTRTRYYTKPEKFADYIFTSPEVPVKAFSVLPDQVSDHAPLLIEFY
jgi:endonuclease/exonuclease/phosphatase family metal-dependent hydrolase